MMSFAAESRSARNPLSGVSSTTVCSSFSWRKARWWLSSTCALRACFSSSASCPAKNPSPTSHDESCFMSTLNRRPNSPYMIFDIISLVLAEYSSSTPPLLNDISISMWSPLIRQSYSLKNPRETAPTRWKLIHHFPHITLREKLPRVARNEAHEIQLVRGADRFLDRDRGPFSGLSAEIRSLFRRSACRGRSSSSTFSAMSSIDRSSADWLYLLKILSNLFNSIHH